MVGRLQAGPTRGAVQSLQEAAAYPYFRVLSLPFCFAAFVRKEIVKQKGTLAGIAALKNHVAKAGVVYFALKFLEHMSMDGKAGGEMFTLGLFVAPQGARQGQRAPSADVG